MTTHRKMRACAASPSRAETHRRAADGATRIWRSYLRRPVATPSLKIPPRKGKIVVLASNRILRCMPVMFAGVLCASAQTGSRAPVIENSNDHEKLRFFRSPYQAKKATPSDEQNSPRIYELLRANNIYLSLSDAIALAIENNLDVQAARYQLPIAGTDVLRSKGGGTL